MKFFTSYHENMFIAKNGKKLGEKLQACFADLDMIREKQRANEGDRMNLMDMDESFLEIDIVSDASNCTAKKRVIVVTVCLSMKITDDEEAYRTLVDEIGNLQTSFMSRNNDFVLFIIGSPYNEPLKLFPSDR